MRTISILSPAAVVAILLLQSWPAETYAQLQPTPIGDIAMPGANSSSSGLDVPDRWSTLENGMLIPHPVTMNGRVLMTEAIRYYSKWKGLPDPPGARKALSDYLYLAALRQVPELLESKTSAYALRFLSGSERGKYACNSSDELKKGDRNAFGACQGAYLDASWGSPGSNLNFWLGATEVKKRQSRQAFLDDYRDRLLAAAPKLPIELLDFRYFSVSLSRYDRTKGGVIVNYKLPGSHLLNSTTSQIWFSYETDIERTRSRIGPIFSEFWPIELAEGQVIVHRFGGNVPIQHYMTMTELKDDSMTRHFDARLCLNSVVAYKDPLLEQELYRFKGFADKIVAKIVKADPPGREEVKVGTQSPSLEREPHPFAGFTVMEIGNEYIHHAVGMNPGFRRNKATVLMTLIAGNRSYASITKGYDLFYPDVVTWIRQEEGAPHQIVLGDGGGWRFSKPPSVWRFTMSPLISAEFRLQRLGPKQALFIKDDLRVVLPIVANYPVLSIDWSDPLLSRFRINGYGLGPVTKNDIAMMYPHMKLEDAARQQPKMGKLKRLSHLSQPDSGQVNVSALADVDRLISEGQAEIVVLDYRLSSAKNLGLQKTFYETMLARYGTPSAVFDGPPPSGPIWVWAHDLHGRLLSEGEDSNDPCLKHVIDCISHAIYSNIRHTEAGPWSCGLVMTLANVSLRMDHGNPSTTRVTGYKIHLSHGHAMAHHIFSDRMDVVEAARKNIPSRAEQRPDKKTPPRRRGRRGRRGGGR